MEVGVIECGVDAVHVGTEAVSRRVAAVVDQVAQLSSGLCPGLEGVGNFVPIGVPRNALSGVPEDDRLCPWTAAEVGQREVRCEFLEARRRREGGRPASAVLRPRPPAHVKEAQTVTSEGG